LAGLNTGTCRNGVGRAIGKNRLNEASNLLQPRWTCPFAPTNGAVRLPEDRKYSRRNATLEKSTRGATALYGALMAHGLDEGLDDTFAPVSLFPSQGH